MKEIAFTKVKLPYGWLGNMSPHPIAFKNGYLDDKIFKTAEHLFQCLRFEAGNPVREQIRLQVGPMQAKFCAKHYADQMIVAPRSEQDVFNMRFVLLCKLEEHPGLRQQLLATGDATLIEDCSSRPNESGLFWGAARIGTEANWTWTGKNTLGNLWMEIRQSLRDNP